MEQNSSYHYAVIKRAIEIIDQAPRISLSDLSGRLDMSPSHFQRTFSQWVGVSPKKYQEYLAFDHAKALLRQRYSTLKTADEAGLSSQGRLHDLFLRWEAMSPGEFANRGAGMHLNYGWFDSPFGEAVVMGTDRGICGIAFASEIGREGAFEDLRIRWPEATYEENTETLRSWVETAFGQTESARKTPLVLIGAPFQIKVWEALLRIPSGYVTTYSDIADAIGKPKAVRAVGTAIGRNPVSWLIPCHRALRKSGELGGYHWGLGVKRALLAYEAARSDF